MAELEGLSVSLTADTGGLDRGMRSAEQSVARTERAVTASASRMDQAMERINRSAALVTQRLNQFGAVLGIGGIAAMAAKTLDYAEAWTQVGNRLRLVASDAGQMKATQEQLFQAAQKAGVSMGSVVDVYSRAAQAAGELGASQEQLTRFSGGVAQALAVSGTSAEAASGAMQQLGQLLGSTRVQAEEFNSILDGAPRVAKAVADGLTEAGGSVSRLKQLINDGKVTNKQFFDAFLGQIPKIQAEFDTAVPTIGRALATLNNAMGKLIGEANEAAGVTTTMARGLTVVAGNLDTVAAYAGKAALALAAFATTRMVPAGMAALTRAIDDQRVALYAKAVATLQAAKAEQLAAVQALITTQRTQASTAATVASAEAEFASRSALAGTAASNIAAAEASLLQAKAKTSLTTNVYVLNRAMAAERDAEAAVVMAREASIAADTAKEASLVRLRNAQLAAAASGEAVAAAGAHLTAAVAGEQAAVAAVAQRASLLSAAWGGIKAAGAGLLTMVGGPWGAAFLAAGAAVYYLSTRTTEADKAQEAYNRTLSDGRQRVQELTSATREQANALLEKQRNEVAAAQDAATAAQAELAAQEALYKRTGNVRADGSPNQTGVMRQLIEVADTTRKRAQAAAAALDAMNSIGQKTGDAVGLELASKLSRGTSAFMQLSSALGDALKQAGLTVQSGKLMTNEQAETEKAVTALGQALKAGSGFLRSYGTSADQVTRIIDALKLKIDPVASAIADMNRELAQAGAAEGAARTALTVLQSINQQREKEGKAPLTTVSPEYLTLLGKAQEVETKRVESATAARAKVLDLDKQIAKAQAAGNAAGVAELQRQKAVEQMVARGTDRKVAEANAAQDYAVAIAEAGAAAGQAGKEILLAADAQMVMARAAGLGEAATRQATYATKLAQEAAKGNGNVLAVQAANRREEAAAIVQIRNETVRSLELETANTNALTLAMASGGAAVRVAQEQEYKLALIRKLGTDATVAGTEAQQALNKAMDAYRKNRAANDNNKLQQERQSANDNLALAQRELDLMGQAEPVRERALTTLRNQQEAARKVAELGEDGARQWLAWQEQIADKRAMIDYLKSVQQTAKEISGDISQALYDRLMDQDKATSVVDVFKSIFKRIAIAALETNIVLPIVTQVVGSMPSLFGIQAPAGAAGTATNGLTSSLTNTALSQGGSWAMDKLGLSNITGNIMNTPAWGSAVSMSSVGAGSTIIGTANPIIGQATGAIQAGSLNAANGVVNAGNTAALNASYSGTASGAAGTAGASLGSVLGTAGIGFGVGNLATSLFGVQSKGMGALVGAGSGAAAGALAGTFLFPGVGTLIGALLGGGSGLLGGLLGAQKPSVGPTASADLTVGANGKASVAGNYLTDNEGSIEAAKQLGAAFSTIFTAAAAGGGTLVKNIGIGRTEKEGLYVGGSVPYKKYGDDLPGLLRDYLLELGGLKDAGPAVTKAIKNNTAKDFDEAAKNIVLGAAIDAGTTALSALDKSLNSFTKSAKAATTESLKPMLDELERAKGLDLGSEYVKLATDQLNAYLDQLRSPPDYTQVEQDMASLTGQFQAIREAYQQLNPALAATVDQIEAETRARIKASVQDDANRQLNNALGRDYLNSITDLTKTRDTNARNLTAVGLSTQRATEIFDASLKTLLEGLDSSQLDVIAASFTGGIHDLAVGMRDAARATETATKAAERAAYQADLNSRMYAALGNDRASGLIALDQQQAVELAGYDTTQLRMVQAAERSAKAFQLAQADVLAAYDAQITAQQALVESLQTSAQAMQQFRQAYDALAVNDNSPLNARDRLAEARRQFEAAYTTAKDASASEAEKTAALATLQQLGPTLVQLAKGFYGSTDTTDYNRVRQVFAEFAGLQSNGVDTAQSQLDTANATLKELQRQRADAASLGQKQYGALTGLKDVMDQSYAVWLAALTPLKALTGSNDNTPRYAAPANVQAAWNGLSGDQQMGIARAMGWGGSLDQAFNIWLATSSARASTFGGNVLSIAGGTRYGAPAGVQTAWDALTQAQQLAAIRSAGYDGGIDSGLNAWVALGHQAAFEAAVKAQAHLAGIPGYAVGTPSALPGLAWVGERGPELVRMAGGERVYPHETSMAMARRFQAANDRWGGNVTALRAPSIAPIVIDTAGLEQRLDRAVAVLERILGAIEAGDDETLGELKSIGKQLGRSAAPVGQRRAVNG